MNRALVEQVERLLAKERGTVRKDPGGRTSVCLVYPNTYSIGMSNLGFQGVYAMLNDRDDTVCERAFLPDNPEEYVRTGTELFSFESKRSLARFDIVAFSVSFENDYPNILRTLALANIPLGTDERGPAHPLVVLGGPCAFSNPEPLAPFVDAFFIGEAEGMLDEFMDLFSSLRRNREERESITLRLASITGIYVPSLYDVTYDGLGRIAGRTARAGAPEHVTRRHASDISRRPIRQAIVTTETEFSGMRLIEAMRGCPWSCRFCLAGHVYDPPRQKTLEAITREIEEARAEGLRVGLVGPSLSDYKYSAEVLAIPDVDFSITSLRAHPRSAELVRHLRGRKSVSIAPEAGTERLRAVIGKKVTEEDILGTASLLRDCGIGRLRLYFMVGLPTETDEDIEGIVTLVRRIENECFTSGTLSVTLSVFVPKPFTPFERFAMTPLATIKKRLALVKKGLRQDRRVSISHDAPRHAYMQALFARGDRRVGAVLRSMLTTLDLGKAARDAGVDTDWYVLRPRDDGETLPWGFISP
jgi:radical SAM superfamily enzyme YgiQ (UPF0313 family)